MSQTTGSEKGPRGVARRGVPASRRDSDSAAYRPSHNRVLRSITAAAAGEVPALDAVIVPTHRPLTDLPGLRLAAQIAVERECYLVVLLSGKASEKDLSADIRAELGERLVVLDVGDLHPDLLPHFTSAQQDISWRWRTNDVGLKRNVGLLISVLLDWRFVLFLDDDVSPHTSGRTLDRAGLDRGLAEFAADPDLRAVGWALHGFDDNSVAGHARRLAGAAQDIFIGGAALAVRCDVTLPFFPGTYNEDWLFLIALAADSRRWRGSCAEAGRLHQLPYAPFRRSRAQSEEVGDILAEGLLNLLEDDGPALWPSARSLEYWQQALSRRRQMLIELAATLRAGSEIEAGLALKAGLDVHGQLTAADFVEYVEAWKNDLEVWRGFLTDARDRSVAVPSDPGELIDGLRHPRRMPGAVLQSDAEEPAPVI